MNAQAPVSEPEKTQKVWDQLTCSRVGKCAAFGFTNADIAESMGLSVEEVAEVRLLPETLKAQQEQMIARQEQAMLLEDGWNALEEVSLSKLLQIMQLNSDPDFFLHAARVANQATRRGSGGRRVLDAGRAGGTITLNLGVSFVEKVQKGGVVEPTVIEARPKKVSDILSPAQASRLLGVETQSELEADIQARIAGVLTVENGSS